MSLDLMSPVDFQKWLCRHVNFMGLDPLGWGGVGEGWSGVRSLPNHQPKETVCNDQEGNRWGNTVLSMITKGAKTCCEKLLGVTAPGLHSTCRENLGKSQEQLTKGRRQNSPAAALDNHSISERPWSPDTAMAFQGPLATAI